MSDLNVIETGCKGHFKHQSTIKKVEKVNDSSASSFDVNFEDLDELFKD